MLINKWLIADEKKLNAPVINYTGICLPVFSSSADDIVKLYKPVQQLPGETSFSLLFSGLHFNGAENDSYLAQKVIGLFFMPAYIHLNYEPVLFVQYKTPLLHNFLEKLSEESRSQGIPNIVIKELGTTNGEEGNSFVYLLNNDDNFDLSAELKKWTNENSSGNNPPELNLLIPEKKKDQINNLLEAEQKLKETEAYKIANAFYQKQVLVEEAKHQLYLKAINERNIRFYLSIQKEERAKGLKWYYYEYEILPTWYKQFGHIIKVIMGKRTFRSLFNDNVKKYKD
ncbi:MAG: hypothetical protein JSS98_05710 [Bacteroidetes bacterium]|nr:hypothetical protein [Bacteroidota bacterium]